MNNKEEKRERIHARVLWWINDAAFKPPEINWTHYYECMANDIAAWAVDDEIFEFSANRLDP